MLTTGIDAISKKKIVITRTAIFIIIHKQSRRVR